METFVSNANIKQSQNQL